MCIFGKPGCGLLGAYSQIRDSRCKLPYYIEHFDIMFKPIDNRWKSVQGLAAFKGKEVFLIQFLLTLFSLALSPILINSVARDRLQVRKNVPVSGTVYFLNKPSNKLCFEIIQIFLIWINIFSALFLMHLILICIFFFLNGEFNRYFQMSKYSVTSGLFLLNQLKSGVLQHWSITHQNFRTSQT